MSHGNCNSRNRTKRFAFIKGVHSLGRIFNNFKIIFLCNCHDRIHLTGNSGVGKSSILNALDPAFQLKTGEISTALGRGRHTTRHVELFRLSCGAEIMDSPGFSSFETEELNLELKHRLPETFREFAPYLGECQFLDCSHTKEKGCAVREALEAGKLQPSRYQSYLRLFEELKPLREWQEKRK